MKINQEKTVYARITRKTKNVSVFNYMLDGKPLTQVRHFKYLGITISDDLSWKKHITNLCNAAEVKLWSLRRKLKFASRDVKLTAYLTLIRPALEYGSIIWDPHTKNEVKKIEKIQRRAARFIMSKYRYIDSATEMLTQLKLPELSLRRKVARLKFIYLMKHNCFNFNPHRYIENRTSRISRFVRSSHEDQFVPIPTKVDAFKYSLFPKTIEEWNALPHSITQINSTEEFEKTVLAYYSSM